MSTFFAIIRILLGLIGAWESFLAYTDKIRAAEAEKKNQDRDKAIDAAQVAKTPEEAWDAQTKVVDNIP